MLTDLKGFDLNDYAGVRVPLTPPPPLSRCIQYSAPHPPSPPFQIYRSSRDKCARACDDSA